MPEIKNIFTSGRMNKDLDERIISKDEYRDALNIDVVTSEGSNVGTIQNVRGNTKVANIGITGQQCIGAIRNTKTNKIYWFIAGTSVDAIVEYDPVTGGNYPILVSVKATQDVLKFDTSYLITGINIIDNLMFFTDDKNEPKCINIDECRKGCDSTNKYSTHTKFYVNGEDKGNIKEEHITTIKKYPLNAPTLTMARTKDALRTGVSETKMKDSGSDFVSGTVQRDPGFQTGYLKFQPAPNFKTGDVIILKSPKDDVTGEDSEHTVRVKLTGTPDKDAGGTYIRFTSIILSISNELASGGIVWTATLEKEDPIFEIQFPRFAYRWKYSDGEYSAFSPFSEIAFLPDDEVEEGIFDAKDGYNLAMTNNLRSLKLGTFDTRPDGCIEVDILVKQANDTNVYTVKTLTDDGDKEELNTVESGGAGFEVVSEQVHAVLPSNQLLRPYDNVPRKAKAQEVTKNRIVYGNYLQNFSLEDAQPEFEPAVVTAGFSMSDINKAKASLKSIRTYQMGVVFLDQYGRQTPVITHDSAVVKISQADSDKQNTLQCKIKGISGNFDPPSWATHYKYYIKENSGEYYNLALDRFYSSEDGNMWLSFASSDRNKVDIDTYLILKKAHTKNIPTFHDTRGQTLKYKIIAISDVVPSFLKKRKVSLGKISTQFGISVPGMGEVDRTGFPEQSYFYLHVPGPDIATDASPLKDLAEDSVGDKYIRIANNANASDYYKIESIEPVNAVKSETTYDAYSGTFVQDDDDPNDDDTEDRGDYWKFKITKPFGQDIAFTKSDAGDETPGLTFEVFKEEDEDNKPEFEGRFFVKVNRDKYLKKYLVSNAPQKLYSVLNEQELSLITLSQTQMKNAQPYFVGAECFNIDKAQMTTDMDPLKRHDPPSYLGVGKGTGTSNKIELRLTGFVQADDRGDGVTVDPEDTQFKSTSESDFHKAISSEGTLLRFKDDDSNPESGRIYTIEGTPVKRAGYNYTNKNGKLVPSDMKNSTNKAIRYEITLDKKLSWNPITATSDSTPLVAVPELTGIDDHRKASGKTTTKLQILQEIEEEDSFSTPSPAIFETEPKEQVDLDIYHETHQTFPIADIGTNKTLKWHNCFSFGTGLESNRIRDDFNQVFIDKGPKVSTVFAEQYDEERREAGMIYSGIFNSTSGINRLNQFIQAEKITKDINPAYGSIQKLHTRDSDLVVLCEDKCLKVLANKDALFNADGNANLTATQNVLGQSIPFVGDYGISKNPESFACYAFRSYWVDKARGAVLRLSRDGLTNISNKGMRDYFSDKLKGDNYNVLPGGYDEDKDLYNITLKNNNNSTSGGGGSSSITVSYSEPAAGWTSRKSFYPQNSLSINSKYYSIYQGNLWEHNHATASYGSFYGTSITGSNCASVKFIFNDKPSSIKNFKTLNYEGTDPEQTKYAGTIAGVSGYTGLTIDEVIAKKPTLAESDALTPTTTKGWYCDSITTSEQTGEVKEFKDKEGKWFSSIRNKSITATDLQTGDAAKEFAIQGIGNASADSTDAAAINGGSVTVTLNKATGGADYTFDLLSDPNVQTLIKQYAAGSINTSVQFVITPPAGKVVTAADFDCTGETSSPESDCINHDNVTFANQAEADSFGNFGTDNTILVTVPVIFTHGNAPQSIVANITGDSTDRKYSVNGTYTSYVENATSSGTIVKGKIKLARVADTSKGWEYEVTNVVDGTGYWKLTVQNAVGGVSPLGTFPGGDDLLVTLYDLDNNAFSGFTNKTYDWNQNTQDSDPTQGIIKANNQVPQNATILYIDEEDKTGANLDGEFTTLKDSGISQTDVAYTATGTAGQTVTIDLDTDDGTTNAKVFTAKSGFDFNEFPPTISIKGDGKRNYVKVTPTDTGAGSVASPLTARSFTVQYKIPHKNVDGDKIIFRSKTEKQIATSTNQLYDFSMDQTTINQNGETRTLSISGDANSQVIVDAKNASNNTIMSGPVTLTIPASGTITQDIDFPVSGSSTTYSVTMTETGANRFDMNGSFTGASGSAGSRIKTLSFNQRADVTVTFSATTSNSSLTIDGHATTSNITSTGRSESEPVDEVALTYVVSSGNNGAITANSATSVFTFDHTKWTGTLDTNQKTLSNGSIVQYKALKATMNNNTATITGTAYILKYGTANDTSTMDVDAFLAVVATAPTATGQTVSTVFDTAKVITLAGTDPQGGTNLNFAIVNNPTNGTLSSITEGSALTSTVTYTPNSGYSGTDSFTFTVTDGTTVSSSATVNISITGQSFQWSVDNRGTADANTACNQAWGTGGQIDTVYADTSVPTNGMRFYTDSALTTSYNPATNGTSSAPNDSHRFVLGAAGGNCGYHGIIGSLGHVNIIYDCCNQ